jgi:hypothetical protein
MGMGPEIAEMWMGMGDVVGLWSAGEKMSKQSFVWQWHSALQLLDMGSCECLRVYYEAQQFRTPVVLSAA